ncbi:MAG: DUF1572 family protein [Chitinophagales bacterium]
MIQTIKEIYLKNYDSLISEIQQYKNEEDIWKLADGISNSAGNLILHLNGNLNLFIGTVLGNTGYIRDRDREFSDKNVRKEKLLSDSLATKQMIEQVLSLIPETDAEKNYPSDKFADKSTAFALMYFLAHFNYHLGQINYHRRLVK